MTPSARSTIKASPLDTSQLLESGRNSLTIEARAVAALSARLGPEFAQACHSLHDCKGRVIVTGMGKSGHIAGKIAATLASTGTPAFFLHPAEAAHGDLGMITRDDVLLALSNSGETAEILALLPSVKRLGVALIALTGVPNSTLALAATVHIDVSVAAEACPLNLAPTASTTAALAMGDALAVSLLRLHGFTETDFAQSHPGGALGRRLLLRVADIMHADAQIPRISPNSTVSAGLLEMTRTGLGMTTIVDTNNRLLGIFTDGDLRRALDRKIDVHETHMREVMTTNCQTIAASELAATAVLLMEKYRITALAVIDQDQTVVGALNVHDLLRAGVM
jgi:arabinose-5-phosphate isomerase